MGCGFCWGCRTRLRWGGGTAGASSPRRVLRPLHELGDVSEPRVGSGHASTGNRAHPHRIILSGHTETVQHPPSSKPQPSTHGCPFQKQDSGMETRWVTAPTTRIRSERELARTSRCPQIPTGPSPQSCLANTTGALTPVGVPHARAPTRGGGQQLQPHKEGEQKSSVCRQRRGCAGLGGEVVVGVVVGGWVGGFPQKAGNAAKSLAQWSRK